MGTVYAVEHVLLRKRMAMKLLRTELGSNPEQVRRFQNEAVSASSIGHENIVSVTDFGWTQAGQVYLVMEMLEGLSLGEALQREPGFPVARSIDVAAQICRACAAAHSAGIVHRDLKPDNVFLVQRNGQPELVKLLDFGISKVGETGPDGTRLTRTGMIIGTPEYMSPEQSAGRPVDSRTDVYAWGVLFFEMLTGRLPFQADNPIAMLMKHQQEPPLSLSDVRPDLDLPSELWRIVSRALAKRPQDRFQTMNDCLAELLAFAEATPPPAPETARESPPEAVRPNKPLSPTLLTPSPGQVPPPEAPSSPTPALGTAARPAGIILGLADRLCLVDQDLRRASLSPEEGFLASRLHGLTPTVEEVLQTSGMPRSLATDLLHQLVQKGIVARRLGTQPPGMSKARSDEADRGEERRERTKSNPLVARFAQKQGHVRRGRELLARGRLEDALAELRSAAALDRKDGEIDRLIADTQATLDQGKAERLYHEGLAAEARGDFSSALDRFREAMRLRPQTGRYVERVARKLLYNQSDFNEARRLADKAVQLSPRDPDARATLARAYLLAGLQTRARRELETVLELDHNHRFAKSQMKKLRWWNG